jgi:hypothetical protein
MDNVDATNAQYRPPASVFAWRASGFLLAAYGAARLLWSIAMLVQAAPFIQGWLGRLDVEDWNLAKLIFADALPSAVYLAVGISLLRRRSALSSSAFAALLAALTVEVHTAFVGPTKWSVPSVFFGGLDRPLLATVSAAVVAVACLSLAALRMRDQGYSHGRSADGEPRGSTRLRAAGAVLAFYGAARLAWMVMVLGEQEPLLITWEHHSDTTKFLTAYGLPSLVYLVLGARILRGRTTFLSGTIALGAALLLELLGVVTGFVDLTTYLYDDGGTHLGIQLALSIILVGTVCGLLALARSQLPLNVEAPVTAINSPMLRAAGLLLLVAGIIQVAIPAAYATGNTEYGWLVILRGWALDGASPRLIVEIVAVAGTGVAAMLHGWAVWRGHEGARKPAMVVCLLGAWFGLQAVGSHGFGAITALGPVYATVMACAFVSLVAWPPEPLPARRNSGEGARMSNPAVPSTIPDGEGWQQALVASLQDSGVAPIRTKRLFNPLAVVLLGFAAVAILFGRLLLPELLADQPPTIVFTSNLVWIAAAMLVISPAVHAGRRLRMAARARGAVDELSRNRGRRPILYLRSFEIDRATSRPSLMEFLGTLLPLATREEKLARILSRDGPVIAIGRPGERLPQLGAARFYVSDELWQQKIADIAKAAQLVVWTTGVSDGLRWEISHLLKSAPLEKLAVWAHPRLVEKSRERREAEWSKFCATLGRLFPKPLPQPLGDTELFVLSNDGTPVPVEPQLTGLGKLVRPFTGALGASLRQVLALKLQRSPVSDGPRVAITATG